MRSFNPKKTLAEMDAEHAEKVRRIRAGEIPCDFCNVKLNIPVCPRCLRTDANIPPKQRVKTSA